MAAWTQPWLLALAAGSLALLARRSRETRRWSARAFWPALLWAGFAGVALLNPSHTLDATGTHQPRAGWIAWLPTTADAAHTLADAGTWLAALLLGAGARTLLRDPRAVRRLWAALALNGCALAIVGALFHFAHAEKILGAIEPPEASYFFATFGYKNHWAAYGALGAIAAFALALEAWPAALAGQPAGRGRALLFGSAGLLTLVTLPLPGSRAGALLAAALLGGFGVRLFALARREARARGRPLVIGTTLIAAIVVFGAIAYAPRAREDFARSQRQLAHAMEGGSVDLRVNVSADTWRMARARPWFGWGPGCFELVFPLFQGPYLRDAAGRAQARFEFAHNDWLQMLAEDGAIGTALLLLPALLAARGAWRRAGGAGRAALAGVALIAAYAWIDFPLHNPAVLVLWTLLLTTAHRIDPRAAEVRAA